MTRKSDFVKTMFERDRPINHSLTLEDVIKKKEDDKPKADEKKPKLTGKVTIIRF